MLLTVCFLPPPVIQKLDPDGASYVHHLSGAQHTGGSDTSFLNNYIKDHRSRYCVLVSSAQSRSSKSGASKSAAGLQDHPEDDRCCCTRSPACSVRGPRALLALKGATCPHHCLGQGTALRSPSESRDLSPRLCTPRAIWRAPRRADTAGSKGVGRQVNSRSHKVSMVCN